MLELLKNMEMLFLICFISGVISIIFIIYMITSNIIGHIKMYYIVNSKEFSYMKNMFNEIFSKQTEDEKKEFEKTKKYVSKKTYNFENKSKGKKK